MGALFAENLVDGHRLLPVLLADFEAATRAIHVSIFLFFDDPIGEQIELILERKARSGVAVRVLLNIEKTDIGDPFSTGESRMMKEDPSFDRDPTDVTQLCSRLTAAGVQVLDTELDYDKIVETGEPALDQIAREIREAVDVDALHIDHRKIITIDGRAAYCGSANFGAQYLHHRPFHPAVNACDEAEARRAEGDPEPWWKWHDGLVRFEGRIVHDLDVVFRERWRLGGGADFEPLPAAEPRNPRGVRIDSAVVVKNEPSSRENAIRSLLCACIAEATESIFIQNPYLYHPAIIEALLAAKARAPALRVTLVVPGRGWNDNHFAQDAQEYHYPAYLTAGIEVFEYQNHFNHLKLCTFDGRRALVGSANLNFRSLEDDKDFEACVLVEGQEFAQGIDRDVRDFDLQWCERLEAEAALGGSLSALRVRVRDPRTLLMIASREL
ncbi:MAG: phosphatidylserine/phosphatidylglycerophosphate/cardiolipin synthase family protein [Polyangiaceae bacterium]